MDNTDLKIIDFIKDNAECSSKEVFDGTNIPVSYATLKRTLSRLVSENYLSKKGRGRATKYILSPVFEVVQPIDIDSYYEKEIDERDIKEGFNFSIVKDVLSKHSVFTENELKHLRALQNDYQRNISQLSETAHKKAMLLFYEQNNISAMKEIFLNQFEFAVKTYF